jgi:hypothetical protein
MHRREPNASRDTAEPLGRGPVEGAKQYSPRHYGEPLRVARFLTAILTAKRVDPPERGRRGSTQALEFPTTYHAAIHHGRWRTELTCRRSVVRVHVRPFL